MLDSIYDRIKDEIRILPKNVPVIIYTGVGTFAGMKNDNGVVEPQNYHQFPPFLQELYRVIPKLHVYIVLIDPIQENPPYLTRDFPLTNSAPDTYRSNQLTVCVLRQRVYTQPHAPIEDAIDITEALRDLNTFAMQESVSTVYHNYTGVRNHMLAEYFDPELQSELDHIIYGLSMRRDHGCYFDLAALSSYLPYRVQDGGGNGQARTQVQFFNYYKYLALLNFDMGDREKTLFPIYMQAAIEAQKDEIVEEQKQHLKINILSTLRRVYQIKSTPPDSPPEEIQHLNLDYLPNSIQDRVHCYRRVADYTGLYDFLLCYFGDYLNVLSLLLQQQQDYGNGNGNGNGDGDGDGDGGHNLLQQIIAHPNPYKWALPVQG